MSLQTSWKSITLWGSANGSGRNSTAYTTLKTAVVAPMQSASVSTTASARVGLRRSERKANRRSFIASPLAERRHGVGARRPARRHIARCRGDGGEEQGHGRIGAQVRGGHTVEERPEHPAARRGGREPDGQPDQHGGEPLTHHHPEHVLGTGAERYPDAELARPLH